MSLTTGSRFRHGFGVGSAAGTVFLALLLVALIPTNEFRARLWFILESRGPGVPLQIYLWPMMWVPAIITLAITRRVTIAAVVGAGVASAVYVALLSAGLLKWIPEFPKALARFAIGSVLVLLALVLGRRSLRSLAQADAA